MEQAPGLELLDVVLGPRKWERALEVPTGAWPGARPTKHISIEFEIRWKFKTL